MSSTHHWKAFSIRWLPLFATCGTHRAFKSFLLRNFTFGVLIGATPALIPVIGLKALHLHPLELGFVFICMGLGSLAGALFILEPARKRLTPNQMTLLSSLVLAASYMLMAMARNPQVFFIVAALAGVAWTVSASELWVAGESSRIGSEAE
jgi:Na+/melibiose symporter-like transporter